MSTIQEYGATGTTGAAVSLSNSTFTEVSLGTGNTAVFADPTGMAGTLAIRVTGGTAGNACLFGWLGYTATSMSVRLEFMFETALPAAQHNFLVLRNTAATAQNVLTVGISASGFLNIADLTPTTKTFNASGDAIAVGTAYSLDIAATQSGTAAAITAKLRAANTSTIIDSWSTTTGNTGASTFGKVRLGRINGTHSSPYRLAIMAANDGSTAPFGPTATSVAPVAVSGPDQTGIEPFTTVTLDGSGSTASAGDTLTYAWTQTAGPTVTLSSTTAAKPTFTAPGAIAAVTCTFSLTVTDTINGLTSTADTVNVTTLPALSFKVGGSSNWVATNYTAL